jgi:predicted RecB family nuclease
MRDSIDKLNWLTATACLKQAWFNLRAEISPPTEAERFRMEQGILVGQLAHRLFPDGKPVCPSPGKAAAEVTSELLASGQKTLFEAAFVAGKLIAKADIITRAPGGFQILEVKSSFSDTKKIKEKISDLAYTVMVAKRVGLEVSSASLVLLARDFRFGDGPEKLFKIVDKTPEVLAQISEFEAIADSILAKVFASAPPEPVLSSTCRDCSYFEKDCLGVGIDHSVLEIPGLHHTRLKRLSASKIFRFRDVPDDLELNDKQRRAKSAVLSGLRVVEPGLRQALESIVWPCHYLDFETVATVLPLYPTRGCHEQVLTQFSIHSRDSLNSELLHIEYLADAKRDCTRDLAEKLIQALGSSGSILVYSDFEEQRIRELGRRYPEFDAAIQNILSRLVDLLPIISNNLYDPAFRGSFSIKDVLPVLVPDLSYAGLPIANGDMAIAMFAKMAKGEIIGEDIEKTRRALFDYCKLDTLAMVRLHEVLIHEANSLNSSL